MTDVISVLALAFHPMRIDQMYARYQKDKIPHFAFLEIYKSLLIDGVLAHDENGKTIKGPNWKPPAFMTDKRYE